MSGARVLVIGTMRNEGPYLLEWLAHHRAAGVSDFLIYSNDCEDGSGAMLGLLHAAGVIEHVPQPGGPKVQWRALKDAETRERRRRADWIAVIDCDEFINLRSPLNNIPQLVSQLGEAEAITLPWRLFGSGGAVRAGDAPTTERFTRAAPQPCAYPVAASFFKTLFRRDSRFNRLGIHRPRQRDPGRHGAALWVDGSGKPLPESFALKETRINLYGLPPATDLAQLNHYSLRSAEEFMVKRARGLPNRDRAVDMAYWVERNLNAEEDHSIAHMAAGTAAALDQLRAIPGLAALEDAARRWHREKFAALMQDRAEWQLFGRLLMVPAAQPLAPALARELLALYQGGDG